MVSIDEIPTEKDFLKHSDRFHKISRKVQRNDYDESNCSKMLLDLMYSAGTVIQYYKNIQFKRALKRHRDEVEISSDGKPLP